MIIDKAAWSTAANGRRRPTGSWWYAGVVHVLVTLDTGETQMVREVCGHHHRNGLTARECADRMARRIGWARPVCTDCGAVWDGTPREAIRRGGWSRSDSRDPDRSPLTCAACALALLDECLAALRQRA